jgi:hypothetical protein
LIRLPKPTCASATGGTVVTARMQRTRSAISVSVIRPRSGRPSIDAACPLPVR